ncbi:BTB/POZ domain-containing protein 18 isoform 1-T3 [Theristicus caerulescens]
MGSPSATPRLLYRSTRLLRTAFQHLHQQQQRADVFCDVVLQAEGEAVAAHCCVLSVCSPFFMEQLGRELPPQGHRVVLELGGLKIGALRKLVRFLYTAELEATWEEAQEVLAAARRLRVTELESLQLRGGRLVRPGPQRQLDRSCLRPPPARLPGGGGWQGRARRCRRPPRERQCPPTGAAVLSGDRAPQPRPRGAGEAAEGGERGVLGGGAGEAAPHRTWRRGSERWGDGTAAPPGCGCTGASGQALAPPAAPPGSLEEAGSGAPCTPAELQAGGATGGLPG